VSKRKRPDAYRAFFFLTLLLTTLLAGACLPALLLVAAVGRLADRLGPADRLDFAGSDQSRT
jgi:hypothetical protein